MTIIPSIPNSTAITFFTVIGSFKKKYEIIIVQKGTVNSIAKTMAKGSNPMPKNQPYYPAK